MGAKNTGGQGGMTIVKMVAESKEKNARRNFRFVKKVDGKWIYSGDPFDTLTGQLMDIEFGHYIFEGTNQKTVTLYLKDPEEEGGEKFKLEMNMNNLTRGMLNSFAGSGEKNTTGIYSLKLYVSNKGFNSCFIELNGEKAAWKYKVGEFKTPEKIEAGGQTVQDDRACNEWFASITEKVIIPVLAGRETPEVSVPINPEPATKAEQVEAHNNLQSQSAEKPRPMSGLNSEEEDDLPF